MSITEVVAPAPVTPDVGALYFAVRNDGTEPDRLIDVRVDRADSASIHTMVAHGGSARMEPVREMTIPAGGTVRLAPGGEHVMLSGLRAYGDGDTLLVEVHFARAGRVQFRAPVVPYASLDSAVEASRRDGR